MGQGYRIYFYYKRKVNMFPKIENIEDMRKAVEHIPEIRFMKQENGTTVCCYMISGENTFQNEFALEARGITFDENGKVISRPFHKFFNMNEREHIRFENIDWSKVKRIMDKRDGSLVSTVSLGWGIFDLKSKKSFTSDVVIAAKKWMEDKPDYIDFCKMITKFNMTAIFEWTSPTSRIVLPYKEDCLTLLAVRSNTYGRYFSKEVYNVWANEYDIPMVEEYPELIDTFKDEKALINLIETAKGIEGWVVQFENGDMIKIKTKEYCEKHKTITFLRERDIVSMIVNETIDDLKSILIADNINIDEILKLETEVVECIREIENAIDDSYEKQKLLDRKDFALYYKKHRYFGLLMQKYNGKEPDVKEYFIRNLLPEYSLRQLNLLNN